MQKAYLAFCWVLAAVLIVGMFAFAVPAVQATGETVPTTAPQETATETTATEPTATEPSVPETTVPEETTQPTEPVKQGLVAENGNTYFYNDDSTLFTGGYKAVTTENGTKYYYFQEDGTAFAGGYKPFEKDGKRVYYYFQADGTAYTDGYLCFDVAGKTYYFFFQEDGSAFTGGYKEIVLEGKTRYFYFLSNGQGFNTGYKTVMIDGTKHYFYFGSDGQAVTDKMESIPLGTRTAYMLFGDNGRAYTGGYKAVGSDHYYFLTNGQAFTTGYKTVKLNGTTYYYFFQDNGKAFTGGLKAVTFGSESYYYFFDSNGRARTSQWHPAGNGSTYYFQANGRAAKNTFVTISGGIYYFNNAYNVVKNGWFCVGNGYYYADGNGKLATDTVVQGYKLDAAGKSSTKYRVIQLVNQYTNSSMTQQEKIAAVYDWVLGNSMVYIRTYEHTKADWVWKDSWVDDMAASQLDNWGGNCYRYNALLALLIREATGLPVTMNRGMTRSSAGGLTYHGWACVLQDGKWYVYDVELQKHSRVARSRCYMVDAATSSLHQQGVGTNLY